MNETLLPFTLLSHLLVKKFLFLKPTFSSLLFLFSSWKKRLSKIICHYSFCRENKHLFSSVCVCVLQRWCSPSHSARLRPTPTGSVGLATSTRKVLPTPTSSSRLEEGETRAPISWRAPTLKQTAECVGLGLITSVCTDSPIVGLFKQSEKGKNWKAWAARQTRETGQERQAGEKICLGVARAAVCVQNPSRTLLKHYHQRWSFSEIV